MTYSLMPTDYGDEVVCGRACGIRTDRDTKVLCFRHCFRSKFHTEVCRCAFHCWNSVDMDADADDGQGRNAQENSDDEGFYELDDEEKQPV